MRSATDDLYCDEGDAILKPKRSLRMVRAREWFDEVDVGKLSADPLTFGSIQILDPGLVEDMNRVDIRVKALREPLDAHSIRRVFADVMRAPVAYFKFLCAFSFLVFFFSLGFYLILGTLLINPFVCVFGGLGAVLFWILVSVSPLLSSGE